MQHMEKIKKALEKDDNTLITYGCLAHWLSLLGKDLTPALIVTHVLGVNKYFHNHHIPSALLKVCLGST